MRKAFPWVGRGRKSQALAEVSEARYAGRGAGGGAFSSYYQGETRSDSILSSCAPTMCELLAVWAAGDLITLPDP